jgi:hypothetical protein
VTDPARARAANDAADIAAQAGSAAEEANAELQAEMEEADEVQGKLARRVKVLEGESPESVMSRASSVQGSVGQGLAGGVSAPTVQIALPELPRFSGAPHESFDEFFSIMEAWAEEGRLSAVRAFLTLRGQLDGEALKQLKGIRASEGAWDVAVSLLRDAYHRPEQEALHHWAALVEMPVQTSMDAKALRNTLTEIEVHLRHLDSTGRLAADEQGEFLPLFLATKFPPAMRRQWERQRERDQELHTGQAASQLRRLRDFLAVEVRSAEISTIRPGGLQEGPRKETNPGKAASSGRQHSSGGRAATGSFATGKKSPRISEMAPEMRFDAVRKEGLCFRCLRPGHRAITCRAQCSACEGRHHALLHDAPRPDWAMGKGGEAGTNPQGSLNMRVAGTGLSHPRLQTVVTTVPGTKRKLRILLDTGSEDSFVCENLAKELGLRVVGTTSFSVVTLQGATKEAPRARVELPLTTREGTAVLRCWAYPTLCGAPRGRPPPGVIQAIGGIGELADPGDEELPVAAVLGADALPAVICGDAPVKRDGCVVMRTIFGWVVLGGRTDGAGAVASCLRTATRSDEYLEGCVARMEGLADLGVDPLENGGEEPAPLSPPRWDEEEERFVVGLPFLSSDRPVPNRAQAEARLRAVLRYRPERLEEYRQYMARLVAQKYVEEVPDDGLDGHFLPHHGVWTTKLRVVFDGSAGLNKCLDTGPNLVRQLVEVLASARLAPGLMTFDLKEAFLQVGVEEGDRTYLRFLWAPGGTVPLVYQFRRVPFGTNASPFLLQHVLREVLKRGEQMDGELVNRLRRGLYVDDVALPYWPGEDDPDQLALSANRVLGAGGFALHKERRVDREGDGGLLGLGWQTPSDELRVLVPEPTGVRTRRTLLGYFASVFDPLGWLTPWIIGLRFEFQQLWSVDGMGWDTPLPEDAQARVDELLIGAEEAGKIRIPRFVGACVAVEVYADASPRAYGAAIYAVTAEGERRLWLARGRVAPRKPVLTLPRLELMAALVGVRLWAQVRGLLPESTPVRFYGDSTVALAWIRGGPTRWRTFVRNRVQAIREISSPEDWMKIPTEVNPADRLTRGVPARALAQDDLWWRGPPRGTSGEEESPGPEDHLEVAAEAVAESTFVGAIDVTGEPSPEEEFDALVGRFGSLDRLLKFAERVRRWLPERRGSRGMEAALTGLLRRDQEVHHVDPKWRLESDAGLMRVVSRTGERTWYLPCSGLARLVVWHRHRRLFHQGTSATLAEVVRDFSGPGATRSFVKGALGECRPCRRMNSRLLQGPEGPLPPARVEPTAPFQVCGADFFGPLVVGGAKASVLLVTCAVTRAVHLEIVPNQSAAETALAFRRFAARRGQIRTIICDNALTFRELAREASATFRFIPERSPWWGGFYERMVGTIKRALRTTLGGAALSFTEAATVLAELEERVNRRPLVQARPEEGVVALTPAHFLYGAEPPSLGPTPGVDWATEEPVSFGRRRRHAGNVARALWKRWQSDYLPTLRRWRRPASNLAPELRAGDVVLVDDGGHVKRTKWPLGVVEGLIRGADGGVRAAHLRVRGRLTRRAVQRLVLLEAAPISRPVPNPSRARDTARAPGVAGVPGGPGPAPDPEEGRGPVVRSRRERQIRRPARFDD